MGAVIPVGERVSFRLSDSFLEEFKHSEPDWTVEGYLTYLRTYSARITDSVTGQERNEKWWETCRRVVEGAMSIAVWHLRKFEVDAEVLPLKYEALYAQAKDMFRSMFQMKWTPAGRGLQHMGRKDVIWEKGAAVLNNCSFVSTANIHNDFTYPFLYLMDMSMLGVGTGFDVSGADTVSWCDPDLSFGCTHVVEDTREGWCALLKRILDSFVGNGYFPHFIDYRKVRPLGAPLATMGGVASGPGPLKTMVAELLSVIGSPVVGVEIEPEMVHYGYRDLTIPKHGYFSSTDIVDMMNIIGKCVVSGGIRRTAEISLGSFEDKAFLDLKTDEVKLNAWRSFSNNSIVTDRLLRYEECQEMGERTAKRGDPGAYFRCNARAWGRTEEKALYDWVIGTNPCAEQQLLDKEMCNLVETVPWRHDSIADYLNTLRSAFLYAKIVSLLPTHRPEVNVIQEKNHRVGVSATGVFMAYQKFGRETYLHEYCEKGYRELETFDGTVSRFFDVPFSVRRTSVKPSGSVSLVLGVTSGIRAPEGPFYHRLIQFEQTSPLLSVLREAGYRIEKSVYTPSSYCVYFPVKVPDCVRGVDDVSAAEQIEMVKDMQRYWADNMVSNTIEYQQHEIPLLGDLIFKAQGEVKSLAFISRQHGFEQAPFQRITEEQYNEAMKGIKPIDFSSLHGTVVHEIDERGCDGASCEFVPTKE
jgi:adenosylcobalamin-dependent ribonucleoside-triphosphate reductase